MSKKSPNILSQINVYPVKSIAGISLSNAWVEKQGLAFDRRFMLVQADGGMVTARKYPQMIKITASLTATGMILSYAGKEPLILNYDNFAMTEAAATVWKDTFIAYRTTDIADQWFSDVLGIAVHLLFAGKQSNRIREKIGHNVSFADGYPVLVISEASLEELNRRSPEPHSMNQFRTNLVVSGNEPFVEDGWKRIRIGEVEFEIVKPCERCILTTVDVEKGAFRVTKEPLKTLLSFRANERGGTFFGQNMQALNEGVIRIGDRIEVLLTQPKAVYEDKKQQPEKHITDKEERRVMVSVNGQQFSGNTTETLLEQAENNGLPIMNSCRAGICGACMVQLESGEVTQPDAPGLLDVDKKAGRVLACCSVPKTDIAISA
ncbi:(2Fe-2S)-binding protein [Vibrio sp. HA2012]|uniref:YcbX family protein n=1 Tax=Vibrio sp. HA2012 TaxID=1971595 RepID=UPI000C2CA4AF|nr:YcbX family protein [Vibrio sp. HA2012]PJC87348.1 (2Fe-2S)-binding protein [Vibrio sp. HA2012]